MSIKLIVTDMDGTLLNENVEITDRAAEAILLAQEVGIEFAVATGRTVESGYTLVKEKGIACPFIELNGARLFDENEKLQFTREMEKDDVEELVQIIEHYNPQNQFITQSGSYSNSSLTDFIRSYKAIFKNINRGLSESEADELIIKHMDNYNIQLVDDYDFLFKDPDIQVLKTLFNAQDQTDLTTLRKIRKAVEQNLPNLIVTSASTYNLEINHLHANKGQAVAEFAATRGYIADEVITIGDNINDLTMLKWAKHSYAVANAHDLAKEAAAYLAPSHNEDAVAQIIEKAVAGDNLRF